MDTMKELFGDVIHVYTRTQAIEDGVLIDVTQTAREAGIRFPVALTAAVWQEYVVPDEALKNHGQSTEGRLWDVLWMFRFSAGLSSEAVICYQVFFTMLVNQTPEQRLVTLKAVCGPGDHGEPVITIMKSDED